MLQVSQCLRRNRQRSVGHLMLASLTLFGCFCLFKPCFAQDPNDALFISISRSDFSGVQAAIANGAYIKSDDNRLLDLASKGGNYAIVKLVIEQGVNVNSKTEQGYTALIKAVARNHYAVVKLLIEKGEKAVFFG